MFVFDNVFDETTTNEHIYNEAVRPMISAAFDNHANVSCFAYGQTGSGKTYTMMGDPNAKDLQCPGLYLLSAYDVFAYLQKKEYADLEIWVSFYEIYCNKLYDLLNNKYSLQAREDGKGNICIVGLIEKQIINLKNLMNIIDFGLKSRTTGVTGANNDSSRSHAILQIALKDQNGDAKGKISFIDLAGSERAVDTIDTNKQTKIDGAEINKSLLALKECIRAMDQGKHHKPFRGSKLTLVLRDSFIGNCNTLMIANISPCLSCSEHTLNTLRYADRVKELRKEKTERDYSSNPFENETNFSKTNEADSLSDLLLMPRQHNKTLKYDVTIKKKGNGYSTFTNNLHVNKPNTKHRVNTSKHKKQQINIVHINDLIHCKDNKNIKQITKHENNIYKRGSFAYNSNYNSENIHSGMNTNNNIESISIDLGNEQSKNNLGKRRYHSTNKRYSHSGYLFGKKKSVSQKKKGERNGSANNKMNNNSNCISSNECDFKEKIVPQRKSGFFQKKQNDNDNEVNEQLYVSKYKNEKIKNDEDYYRLKKEHDGLISTILKEEEEFKVIHKEHINQMSKLLNDEIIQMENLDKPGSDIDIYTESLAEILRNQMEEIKKLNDRLTKFKIMIKDEDVLAEKLEEKENEFEYDDNDDIINNSNHHNEKDSLDSDNDEATIKDEQ